MSRRFQCLLAITDITVPKRSKIAYTATPVWKALKQITESPPPTPCFSRSISMLLVLIYLTLPQDVSIQVSNLNGALVRNFAMSAGRSFIFLPNGILSYGRTIQASNGELNDKRFLESFGRLLAYRCETHKACIVALASCKVVHKHVVR